MLPKEVRQDYPQEKHDQAIRETAFATWDCPPASSSRTEPRTLKDVQGQEEFIFLFLVDAHDHKLTYLAPPRLEEMFLGHPASKKRPKVVWEKDNDYSDEHRRIVRALYDAGIRYSDEALGQLIEGLGRNSSRIRASSSPLITARALASTVFTCTHTTSGRRSSMYRLSLSDRSSSPPWTTGLRSPLMSRPPSRPRGADRSGLPGRSLLQPERRPHHQRVQRVWYPLAGHHW